MNKNEMLKRYPIGSKIKLINMVDEPQMKNGLTGIVSHIDDMGQIHVKWENGSSLALIPGTDDFIKN